MNKITQLEPMKGITGKYIVKRYKTGAVDKAKPLFDRATTLKKREAWVLFTVDKLGFNWLVPFAKRLQRKWLNLEERANAILTANFLGVATESDNLVVSSTNHGRNLVCQALAGLTVYTLNIAHLEMGSSATAPAITDTDLTTAVARIGSPSYGIVNNVLTLRFFFSDAQLANGTYREMGTFIDGTISLGTGQMWNHALFTSAYTKATGEDTTIELVITVN